MIAIVRAVQPATSRLVAIARAPSHTGRPLGSVTGQVAVTSTVRGSRGSSGVPSLSAGGERGCACGDERPWLSSLARKAAAIAELEIVADLVDAAGATTAGQTEAIASSDGKHYVHSDVIGTPR